MIYKDLSIWLACLAVGLFMVGLFTASLALIWVAFI